MQIEKSDYEKLGQFYLGREYDLRTSEIEDELVMYDSKDLVTHGVVLGMTGSGKTGLCIGLLEEAVMDNIPAIVIDPKGDIANMMLAFPDFKGSDFRPWINEDDARKKGRTPDEHAEKTARMWEDGIGQWGQSKERVREFRDKVDVNVFTPGSKAGIPVSILSSLDVPPFEVLDDGELLGERIESTVSSLLSLVGVDADPIQSHEAVLLSAIFQHAWMGGESLSIEGLIRNIQKPKFSKVGIIDLESFYPGKKRQLLALKFNNLLASPGFSTWMEGPPLDIQKMLYHDDGRARVSIFSISHLNDSERMFFVSILLNQMLGWMRAQSGTTSLRALLYMDEIYGYLPPSANPPSKKPMLTMLKQARAYGLGVLLATQNPVDLDYKALSNIGTWWLGRLQTERDKARVLDGLEGAAASQDGNFNRRAMEELLAGLGSRVFLMNNVHEDAPVVFHVRWVMSYLRGPMTRRQIKTLMDPKRDAFEVGGKVVAKTAGKSNPMGMSSSSPETEEKGGERPAIGTGVEESFLPFSGDVDGVTYKPHLLREAKVHFSSTKTGVEGSRRVRFINAMSAAGVDWKQNVECHLLLKKFDNEPRKQVGYDELPGFAMNADNYKGVEDDFEDWIYRNERVDVFYAALVKEYSKMGESEGDFRGRLSLEAREMRDEAVDALRDKLQKKMATKESQLDRAEATLDREESEASSAKMQVTGNVVGAVIGMIFGKRKMSASTINRGRSAANSYGRSRKQSQDVRRAEVKVDGLRDELSDLEADMRDELDDLANRFDPMLLELETVQIKPYKKDIDVQSVSLLWVPFDERDNVLLD
ncbi:MAG: hypothetical protein ACI9E1_002179 [Cryomorphaceae bacterium]|jgi:hypothetical protein